jgi:hypothetical protein
MWFSGTLLALISRWLREPSHRCHSTHVARASKSKKDLDPVIIRNALARFTQTDLPTGETNNVLLKICGVARKFEIDSELCKGVSEAMEERTPIPPAEPKKEEERARGTRSCRRRSLRTDREGTRRHSSIADRHVPWVCGLRARSRQSCEDSFSLGFGKFIKKTISEDYSTHQRMRSLGAFAYFVYRRWAEIAFIDINNYSFHAVLHFLISDFQDRSRQNERAVNLPEMESFSLG